MNWYERMNNAMDYIESNINGKIDFEEISKITCQSVSNFQRVFSIVTDIPVSEYIRRRKLTMAAFELQNSNIKVIDLSLKYGYESPEAFTRAFNDVHGLTPTAARKEGVLLKSYPRISFLLTIKGDVVMDYRIETKEAFTVYGIEETFGFGCETGEKLKKIPEFWQDTMEDGRFDQLVKSTNMLESSIQDGLGAINAISSYRETGNNTFPYMLFAYQTKMSDTEGYQQVNVPAATWAIFKTALYIEEQAPVALQNLIKRIYTEWLPNAGYETVAGYELELHYKTEDNKYFCETWIRVIPKSNKCTN